MTSQGQGGLRSRLGRIRSTAALAAARLATTASRATGRGAGGMIGGLVAGAIDPNIMDRVGAGRPTVLVTGTNGKSTTTRMLAGALRSTYTVATNDGGDNMDAGIISALMASADATHVALEVDELHVPHVADRLDPQAIVLLNLSRDQLDRVGEINGIERALRAGVEKHPNATLIANCDDVLITSIAWDHPNVVWVAAGAGWLGDSVTNPRGGGHVVRTADDWYAVQPLADGRQFRRPTPDYAVDEDGLHTPSGEIVPLNLQLPGRANRGNAAQAIACAVEAFDVPLASAVAAAEEVATVAGRYGVVQLGEHAVHLLLAKNPAGWQEALTMLDADAQGVVIAVNAQQGDGEDVSWLWDIDFEGAAGLSSGAGAGGATVVAAGERGTDLAVRLHYAGIDHELIHDPVAAIRACPPGRVEVLANYTALLNLRKALAKQEDYRG